MKALLRKTALIAGALAIGAGAAAALAQGYGPGYGGHGFGSGMMGQGYGPGMMGGGPGYGPGGGSGPGRGYGPGMMGGYGPGFGVLESLNLSDEQRVKILALQEGNRQKNWATMGQMRTEMFALRKLYYADPVDANAVADQQKKVDELRRQMLKSRIEGRNQIESALTPEQRKEFRQYRPLWMQETE